MGYTIPCLLEQAQTWALGRQGQAGAGCTAIELQLDAGRLQVCKGILEPLLGKQCLCAAL